MRAKAAAFILSVSARVSEEHVVRKGNNNKVGVVGNPSRGAHAVVEQSSGIGLRKAHCIAFPVDVSTVNIVEVVRVEDSRVDFLCGGSWTNVEVVVVVSHNASQSSLGGDTHRPRAHVAISGAGAGKTDQGRKVSNVGRAKRRRGPKEVLGSNKVVALNRVTFAEPGRGDDIGGVKKVFR